VIAALGLLLATATGAANAGDTPAWTAMAPGARRATITDGDTPILLFEFDLRRFRADVVVGAGWPPRAQTAAEVRQAARGGAGDRPGKPPGGVVAAVNGGFFDQRRASLGLRVSRGDTRVPLRPRVDWGVLVLADRQARIVHSREFRAAPDVAGAIQVGPRLLVGGAPTTLKPQLARRTAVALDGTGSLLTLVIVDRAIEAGRLAARLAALGFTSALMLDGGPSTQLSLAVGETHMEVPGLYAVPDLLIISAR